MNFRSIVFLVSFVFIPYSLGEEEPPRYWDFNNDGQEDIWYEDSELSYLQHIDRNFDGKADQIIQYDSSTDWPLFGTDDDDFNGIFEVRHAYKSGTIFATLVDSNNDRCFDIIHYYRYQVVYESKKYESLDNAARIITFIYKDEFPQEAHSRTSKESSCDFHNSIIANMPDSHDMPTKRSN